MKLFYGIVLVLMLIVSACAQQPAAEPETQPAAPPEPSPEPEVEAEGTGAAVTAPEEEETVETSITEIRYVGAGGFDPDDITISAGSSVTWINDDNRAGALIIFKDGKTYTTGKRLVSGGKVELELTEPGNYEYWWNIAFGAVSGKITVE